MLDPCCYGIRGASGICNLGKSGFCCMLLLFLPPLSSIVRLADEDYRSNASTSDIIERWMDIVIFPIAFIVARNYFSDNSDLLGAGPLGIIWTSFIAAITIAGIVGVIIKIFVKR